MPSAFAQKGAIVALDPILAPAYLTARQSAGRPLPFGVEESPGSTEIRRRITSGGGDPRDSATESKPPALPVRVKGCGKSAPRGR
jgi:hypothetical protein